MSTRRGSSSSSTSSDPRVEAEVLARIRGRLDEIPDLEARMVRPVLFSFRTPIEVEIHGDNLLELRRMSERVAELMAAMPELADVETSLRVGAPEVQIEYDREQLARYGLNIETGGGPGARRGQGRRGLALQPRRPADPDRGSLPRGRPARGDRRRRFPGQPGWRAADLARRRGRCDPRRGSVRGAPDRRPSGGGGVGQPRRRLARRRGCRPRDRARARDRLARPT